MTSFVDEVRLQVASGHGGPGAVSFRREKYVPRGGPDGGDGGRGGALVFRRRHDLRTLLHLAGKNELHAEDGLRGAGRNKHGRDGTDLIIDVPPGTIIRDADSGQLLVDFAATAEYVLLEGGRGGKGNAHFATSRRQAPRFAQEGEEGKRLSCVIELKLIADIGLVGLPNAGKSSLLSALSNARPKVAAYPFTTTVPHLGVLRYDERDVVIADIPGIIEGASEGLGLGTRFLKHISRTQRIVYLVDLSDGDPVQTVELLERELFQHDQELTTKPRLIVGNKTDIADPSQCDRLRKAFPDEPVYCISVATRDGVDAFAGRMLEFVYPGRSDVPPIPDAP